MFGATPDIFENIIPAKLAAKSYSMEENENWFVASKTNEFDKTFYKPYRKSDTEEVIKDGWVVYPEKKINPFKPRIELDKLRDKMCDIAVCEGDCRVDCPFYMGNEFELKDWILENIF